MFIGYACRETTNVLRMVFICRCDVLLVSLSLLAYGTSMVQAEFINIGDFVELESAPRRRTLNPRLYVEGNNLDNDYTLTTTRNCTHCRFVLRSHLDTNTLYNGALNNVVRSQNSVRLVYYPYRFTGRLPYIEYMSCKSNGIGKGDKCRTRQYCDGRLGVLQKDCPAEVFQLWIHPGHASIRLEDGQMVQFKSLKMNECVNNRKNEKVDMERCDKDSGTMYWKIRKVGTTTA